MLYPGHAVHYPDCSLSRCVVNGKQDLRHAQVSHIEPETGLRAASEVLLVCRRLSGHYSILGLLPVCRSTVKSVPYTAVFTAGKTDQGKHFSTQNYSLAQQNGFTQSDLAYMIVRNYAAHFDNALFPEERSAYCLTQLSSEFLCALLLTGG